jgi:nucleoside-triphosphatase THEP1
MHKVPVDRPILAVTYTDGDLAAGVLRRLWERLAAADASGVGVLQHDEPARDEQSRCDMVLECLSTGRRVKISEDRGSHARGCRLDVGELMRTLEAERNMIRSGTDVLIVNKFGKTEGEGGGFRPLIAAAMELSIPIVIAVPWRNVENWRLFVGDLAVERSAETLSPDDDEAALAEIGLLLHDAAAPDLTTGTTATKAF